MLAYIYAFLIALCGGAFVTFQAPLNAKLAGVIGGSLPAAFISFFIGTVALGAALIITRQMPTITDLGQAAPWMWLGGFLGAFMVFATIYSVPILGATLMIALIIVGQMAVALVIDHTGFLLPETHPISWGRTAGVLLIIGGVLLIKKF